MCLGGFERYCFCNNGELHSERRLSLTLCWLGITQAGCIFLRWVLQHRYNLRKGLRWKEEGGVKREEVGGKREGVGVKGRWSVCRLARIRRRGRSQEREGSSFGGWARDPRRARRSDASAWCLCSARSRAYERQFRRGLRRLVRG